MQPRSFDARLLSVAQWSTVLIPIACSVSRFAADMLLIISAVLFLLHSISQRDGTWLKASWVKVALLLWVYVVISSFFAEDVRGSLGRSASWIRFPLFAAAAAFWILRDKKILKRLTTSLLAAISFMVGDTALQYFAGIELLGRESIPSLEGNIRLTGPFSAPRIGIMLAWMGIPAIAYGLMNHKGMVRKGMKLWLGALLCIGFVTVIFMSGERMALLLTGLGFCIAFFIFPVSKRLMISIGLAIALTIATAAYFNHGLLERHIGSTSKIMGKFTGSDYGQIWMSAWSMFEQNPVTGVGLRQFRIVCEQERYGPVELNAMRCNQHTHNMYLEWLAEAGLIGTGLFLLLMGLMIKHILRSYRIHRLHPVYLGLCITIAMRLWPLASTTSFFTAWSAVPFWLVLGWALAITYQDESPA